MRSHGTDEDELNSFIPVFPVSSCISLLMCCHFWQISLLCVCGCVCVGVFVGGGPLVDFTDTSECVTFRGLFHEVGS